MGPPSRPEPPVPASGPYRGAARDEQSCGRHMAIAFFPSSSLPGRLGSPSERLAVGPALPPC